MATRRTLAAKSEGSRPSGAIMTGFLCNHPRSHRIVREIPSNHVRDNLYPTYRERVTHEVICTKCGTSLHERTERIPLASESYRTSPKSGTEGYSNSDYEK